jgi:Ca2+-binding RTX toxin-like protein
MPTQNSNLNTTWTINTDDDTWTLAKDATITTHNEDGIFVGNDYTGNTVNILGDVVTTGVAASAVHVQGDYNTVNVGKDALIDGSTVNVGLDVGGMQTTINNDGVIKGINSAVSGYIETTLNNTGTIEGGWAVYSQFDDFKVSNSGKIIGGDYGLRAEGDDAILKNLEGGLIKAETAVAFFDGENGKFTNAGKVVGDIVGGNGSTSVINNGLINGDVTLGDGADRFDTRKGTVNGTIDGGDGGDTYLVSSQAVDIAEQSDGTGIDKVRSTIDYTLGENLEYLKLLGKQDIDGTGNAKGNSVEGNVGDNKLKGLGGEDFLAGGRGNDILIGGAGEDIFEFDFKTGHDVINDFTDGKDLIMSDYVKSDADFQDLFENHLKVKGDDLLISYGDDTLLIKDMAKSDLDASDFFMGL